MPPLNLFSKSCLTLTIGHLLGLPVTSLAATIVVDSNTDDGVGCTLREAIVSANNSTTVNNGCANGSASGTDTITFSNSLPSNTIKLSLAASTLRTYSATDIRIDASNISGGITIEGNSSTRILSANGASIELVNLTLSNGVADGGENQGGAIRAYDSTLILRDTVISNNSALVHGAGIYANNTALTLYDNELVGNTITGTFSTSAGGGIHARNGSTVTLNNSQVTNNRANANGGGVYVRASDLTIIGSNLSNNTTRGGGGFTAVGESTVMVENSTISNNSASLRGGGFGAEYGPTVIVNNSTISNNTGSSGGGVAGADATTSITLNNTTVSNNSARFNGGGINNFRAQTALNHSTVANNTAGNGAGIYTATNTVSLMNSIVASSVGSADCAGRGIFISDSASIVEDGSCNALRSGDPGLRPLSHNGGPTQTHALNTSSPARNSSTGTCLTADQRGEQRDISDGACDVGAFEFVKGQDEESGDFFVVPLNNGKVVIFEL